MNDIKVYIFYAKQPSFKTTSVLQSYVLAYLVIYEGSVHDSSSKRMLLRKIYMTRIACVWSKKVAIKVIIDDVNLLC